MTNKLKMKIKFLHILLFSLTFIAFESSAQNSIAVTVFHDIDGNGLQDGADVTLNIITTAELRLWQDIDNNGAITGGDVEYMHDGGVGGVYTFGTGNVLPDDNYILEYVESGPPSGPMVYYVTEMNAGVGLPDMNNDVDPMSNTAGFPLTGGVSETNIDLGLVLAGNIGSFVWEDTDGNGIQDAGEPGIDGVQVTLLDAMTLAPVVNDITFAPLTNPAITAGGGLYSFDDLPPGQYIVEFSTPAPSPDPWYPTQSDVETDATDVTNDSDAENDALSPNYLRSHTIILNSGDTDEEDKIDAGFFQASIIGDMVWEDVNGNGIQDAGEPGIDGVTVSLLDDMGAPAIGADGQPVMDQITAGGGMYQFMLVAPGDYRVEFNLPAPVGGVPWYPTEFNPGDTDMTDPDIDSDANNDPGDPNYLQSHLINIVSGETDEQMRIDAGFWLPAMIGDNVFCDENGNGINDDGAGGVDGIDVRVIDTSTGATAQDADGNNLTTTTAGGGMYMFQLVPPGNYRVEFSFTGATPDPPFVFTGQDDPDGLGDDFTDSDADPDPFGGTFGQTEAFDVISQDTDHETRWDAGVYQTVEIIGTIWLEDDGNNIFNGETGPSGVLVELLNAADGSKVDDILSNQGDYGFNGIPPGEYVIQFDVTGTSIESATPCPGANDPNDMVDNDDNGIDAPMVLTAPFTLLSNCDASNPPNINYIDFCYFFDCNMENPLASPVCSEIQPSDIICDITVLGTFCNIMPTANSGGAQPSPSLCPGGGAPHNISWFAFVAYDGNYSVTVTPTGCSGSTTGQEGVQIGLYTDCTFMESVYCNENCSTNPVTFQSDGSGVGQTGPLEPGQTYYFFIDGCSSSVCSYEVDIEGSVMLPSLAPDDMCINDEGNFICDDSYTTCPGTEVLFEATGLDLTVDYSWSVTALSGGPFAGNSNPMTTEGLLNLTFDNEGTYQVCLDAISNGCQNWTDGICRNVTIASIEDEMFDDQIICQEDLPGFDLSIFDTDDPNMDGTTGWQVTGTTIDFGTVSGTATDADGCTYEQEFELMMHPVADEGVVDLTVCPDELPFSIDQIDITELSFAGILEFNLDDYLLQESTDVNGCDSIIDITVELLDIRGGAFIEPLVCIPQGIVIDFEYFETLSTDEEFLTFSWTDANGNVLPDDIFNTADPTDIVAPVGIGSGTYTLTVTVEKNGVMCDFVYPINIEFDDFLPPVPTISTDGLDICEGDGVAIYAATDFGDAFGFTWTNPTDVASAVISGPLNDTLTIDWTGSAGGTITLTSENGCGLSQPVSIDVTVIPQQIPVFDFTAEVCIDSCSIIEFNGDPTGLTFNWDFDGGTENNGTGSVGPGPHCVSWPDAGDRIITLSYTDAAGCESTVTTEMVTVIAPITPPTPNCNPDTGEVTFTWDDVAGATGYDVEVTSLDPNMQLHVGVLDGNSFTVSNLEDGETVTIILTVFTDDACQMVSIASPGCTSQDCTPPSIELSTDISSFCLDANSGTATITADILTGENGSGIYSGPGIVDEVNGIFDPDSANIGINTITFVYTTDAMPTPCIGNSTIQIEVLETPVASFTPDVDTICITDQINLTYDGTANVNILDWDYGVDGSGTDGATPTVTYTSPGDKTIRLTVTKDGCESEMVELDVFVEPTIPELEVFCSIQTVDLVEFSWNNIPGATGYSVSVNGGAPFTTTQTSHTEMGLSPGDVVMITVTAIVDSRCPVLPGTGSCTAQDCPTFEITFDEDVIPLCVDGNNAVITLEADATGGAGGGTFEWNGPNVVNDQFDPNGLTEGSYFLKVVYIEGGCQGSDSIRVDITTVPEAAFTVDNTTVCIGDTVFLTYTGTALMDQVLTWSPAGLVMDGANPNEYFAILDTEGTVDITLDVVNGACTTAPATESITVEPELVFGEITCNEELNQITFSWDPVDCAVEYLVTVDGIEVGTQTDTEYVADGLMVGQEVTILVEAVSGCACPAVTQTRICEARECTPVDLSLITMDGVTEFCFADDLSPIEIMPQTPGSMGSGTGTWSGTGVSQDGVFDPLTAGVGTHTIVYDFLESEGCPYVDSITFTIFDLPTVTQSFDEILCFDQDVTSLDILPSGGAGNYTITLNGDDAGLTNEVTPGSYNILVTDDNQCTATSSVVIPPALEPSIAIMGETDLTLGDSSTYAISSAPFTGVDIDSIVWLANGEIVCNDSTCFSLGTLVLQEDTDFEVTVHFNDGCSVNATLSVTVTEIEPPSIVTIPNAFSPNGDGENDEWQIFTNDAEVTINAIQVFDRWGNMVWEYDGEPFPALNNGVSWDGRFNNEVLQPGVYVYYIDFIQNERNRIRSGDVTIVN